MRRLRSFRSSDGGASAVEFALILPILAGVLLAGVEGWMRLTQVQNMTTALHTGARYYQEGGTEDDTARALAIDAWSPKPQDAKITVSRTCSCDGAASSCGSPCGGTSTPQTMIKLSAEGTFQGLSGSSMLKQEEILRVE